MKLRVWCLISFFLISVGANVIPSPHLDGKLIFAESVPNVMRKYIVSLRVGNHHKMTAVIASPYLLISVREAICIMNQYTSITTAHIIDCNGEVRERGYEIEIFTYYHSSNALTNLNADINIAAILVKNGPIPAHNEEKLFAAIWTQSTFPHVPFDHAELYGCGFSAIEGVPINYPTHSKLTKITFHILSDEICSSEFFTQRLGYLDTAYQSCGIVANNNLFASPSVEDGGAPLVINHVVFGIFDGTFYKDSDLPAIIRFTKTKLLIPWIQEMVDRSIPTNLWKNDIRFPIPKLTFA